MLKLNVEDVLPGHEIVLQPVTVDVIVAHSEALNKVEEILLGLSGSIGCPRGIRASKGLCRVDSA